LQAAPYNLVNGVYARVTARNAVGNSAASLQGNGAVLPTATVPTAPAAPTTRISGTNVVIEWVAPANGGSAITGYEVKILNSSSGYTIYTGCTSAVVTCTVPISVLQAAPYNLSIGYIVLASIQARNANGISGDSPWGGLAQIPATVPSTPAAPTTVISGSNVLIDWSPPADGGSAITGYTV
jgi:hypothetical protein